MTWWSSLQWQTDNETAFHSFKYTMGLKQCAYTVFFMCACVCLSLCAWMCVHARVLYASSWIQNINTCLILMWLICINLRVVLLFDVILHNCSRQMTTKRLQCLLVSKYIVCFDNCMTFSTLSSVFSNDIDTKDSRWKEHTFSSSPWTKIMIKMIKKNIFPNAWHIQGNGVNTFS